jgi:hypothetical protein
MRIAVAFAAPPIADFSMISRISFAQPFAVTRPVSTRASGWVMLVPMLLMENFARQIFFAVGVYIDFGRGNSAAQHPRNLQPRADVERGDCVFQKLWRHSGIHQRAQKHVAADAGKTVEVGYAHDQKNRVGTGAQRLKAKSQELCSACLCGFCRRREIFIIGELAAPSNPPLAASLLESLFLQ